MENIGLQMLGKQNSMFLGSELIKQSCKDSVSQKTFLETQVGANPSILPWLKQLKGMWLQFGGYTQNVLTHIQEEQAEQAVLICALLIAVTLQHLVSA